MTAEDIALALQKQPTNVDEQALFWEIDRSRRQGPDSEPPAYQE